MNKLLKDSEYIILLITVMTIFTMSSLLIIKPVYGQSDSELQNEVGGVMDTFLSWIYESTDEQMENLEIPDNELNFTKEEAQNIYNSGKEVTDSGVDFIKKTHHLSGDLAQGALPFPVHPDLIFLLGLLVIGIIMIKRHKTITKDIIYIAIGILVLAVIIAIVQLNLS